MQTDFYISKLMVRVHSHLRLNGAVNLVPGVNVLIGKNGSGKTTLLQMLREIAAGGNAPSLTPTELTELGEQDVVCRVNLERGEDGATAIERRKGQDVFSSWESLRDRIRFVTSNRSLRNETNVKGMFSQVHEFTMTEPGDELNVSDEFTKAINSELLDRIRELSGGLGSLTDEIESAYRDGLVDLEKDIRLDFDRDNPVYFVDHLGREVAIGQLSAGEREFLYFFAYLRRIRNDKGKIILIDEPELHLHGTQVRKLCEMLTALSQRNQVIVATHSSDVLHDFLYDANIILLAHGEILNIGLPDDMRRLVVELGLPIDPSVFTAHWVVAENSDSSTLKGANGPTTSEALAWMFGRTLRRRYWGFGSSRASAEGGIELLGRATLDSGTIRLSVLLDGDRNFLGADSWPPTVAATDSHGTLQTLYFGAWEIENLFLNPTLLKRVGDLLDADVASDLWTLAAEHRGRLAATAAKTIVKNTLRHTQSANRIETSRLRI